MLSFFVTSETLFLSLVPGGECHRHGIGDTERTMDLYVAIVIVNFGGDAGKCTDKLDISSAHVQWFSC